MCEFLHSPELDKLATALAKAQGKMRAAAKDASNPHLGSGYASLTSVWDTIREPFAENGLSVSQLLLGANLVTLLMHESGQWLRSEIAIESLEPNRGVNALQAMGSTLTYLRRYALSAIAGVSVGDEDDDGNSAGDVRVKQQPARKQATSPAQLQANGKKHPKRPWSPEYLREYLKDRASEMNKPGPATEAQVKLAATSVNSLTNGDDARRTIVYYLFKKDTSDLSFAEASKLIEWTGCKKETDYQPNPDSVDEAKAIIEAVEFSQEEPATAEA